MRKLAITALVAAGGLVAAAPASAQEYSYDVRPCATAAFLMDKYGIFIAMYFPEGEDALHAVCRVTG